MRVLLVGLVSSIHLVRYAQLLTGSGWEVHLVAATTETVVHPDFRGCVLHSRTPLPAGIAAEMDVVEWPEGGGSARQAELVRDVIDAVDPDIVHAHETSLAGILVDRVRIESGGELGVPWIVTNWGSDLFWFGRDPRYRDRLRSAMRAVPYLAAECHRDVALARAFGFRGEVVGVWPVAGGLDLEHCAGLRVPGPTSERRTVAVKGVTHDYGRGLAAMEAIERCGDLLAGWELCGYQMSTEATERAEEVAAAADMTFLQLSDSYASTSTHDELLAMHGRARVSLGLNRSDALSTSFLEAVALGSFPVQSATSCGYELTPSGRGALFVDPEDVDGVAAALRRALTDDALVDDGAALNQRMAAETLDRRRIAARVLDAYERVAADGAMVTS